MQSARASARNVPTVGKKLDISCAMARRVCLVLALACIAFAARITYEVPQAPAGWRFLADEQPDLDASHVLHISLVQSNLDKLEAALLEVSTPSSPKYGQHWSFDEVGALTAPARAARPALENWLVSNGVPTSAMEWTPYNSWLRVSLSRRAIEELLSYVSHNRFIVPFAALHPQCSPWCL